MLIDEVLEYLGWKGKTSRLWLNDVHPETIKKALNDVKDNKDYRGLFHAACARAYADWLAGLALTRYTTLGFQEGGYDVDVLSVGRVQTPTLGLVVRRDLEIENFTPKDYYNFFAELQIDAVKKIKGKWVPDKNKEYDFFDEEGRIVNEASISVIKNKIDGKLGTITSVKKEKKSKKPPLPYNLSKLQVAANQKFKIMEVLPHIQKLYDGGYVSYPRTGIRHLPEVRFDEAKEVIDAIKSACLSFENIIKLVDTSRKSPAWNDKEVKEHYGIIPTKKAPDITELDPMDKNIYEMIVQRYLLQFLPDYEYEQTSVEFEVEDVRFKAVGRTIINLGWMGFDKEEENVSESKEKEDDDKRDMPSVKEGNTGDATGVLEAKKQHLRSRLHTQH